MNSKKLASGYGRRKRSAEARVVRWEWATQPEGRVAVEREYVGGKRCYESFYEAREWVRYDYEQTPLAQNRLRHEDGRLVELVRDGEYGGFVEQYLWQDGHVVRIDREVTDRKHGWKDWFEITWDGEEGELRQAGRRRRGTAGETDPAGARRLQARRARLLAGPGLLRRK